MLALPISFFVNGTAQVLGVTTNTFDTAAAGLSLCNNNDNYGASHQC